MRSNNYVHILKPFSPMEKTNQLFRMLEHPDHYSKEEWQNMLSDPDCHDIYMLIAKTYGAFESQKAEQQVTDPLVDAEWQRLTSEHPHRHKLHTLPLWHKVAAIFVGILMVSGIALAAVKIIRNSDPFPASPRGGAESELLVEDTTPPLGEAGEGSGSILYDNIPLEQVLTDLSAHYHIQVEYRADTVRHIRLFYQWKPEYTLEKVVEMLNNFEAFQLRIENEKLMVDQPAKRVQP